jgi:hypothetical protein
MAHPSIFHSGRYLDPKGDWWIPTGKDPPLYRRHTRSGKAASSKSPNNPPAASTCLPVSFTPNGPIPGAMLEWKQGIERGKVSHIHVRRSNSCPPPTRNETNFRGSLKGFRNPRPMLASFQFASCRKSHSLAPVMKRPPHPQAWFTVRDGFSGSCRYSRFHHAWERPGGA